MTELDEPLSDSEYDDLAALLARCRSDRAMSLEMLDGFFAALVCSPKMVRPSEYLHEITGGAAFGDTTELQGFVDLVMRYWNTVVHTLRSEEMYLP